jgi:hypothetical protein
VRSDSYRIFTLNEEGEKVYHSADSLPADAESRYEISFSGLPGNALLYWGGFSKPFSVRDNQIIM